LLAVFRSTFADVSAEAAAVVFELLAGAAAVLCA
jgi:hypothetical protein